MTTFPKLPSLLGSMLESTKKKKFVCDLECGIKVAAFVHSEDRRWPDPIVVFMYCHSYAC